MVIDYINFFFKNLINPKDCKNQIFKIFFIINLLIDEG